MFGWSLPCLTLIYAAAGLVPPLSLGDLTLSDWRQMLWSSEECWDEKAGLTFEVCCRYGDDAHRLPSILAGKRKVLGNPRCWQSPFSHDECCVLNGNWMRIPAYMHMIWPIRMPSEAILNVVQGQVLESWEERTIIPPGIIPEKGLVFDGEGLLWGAGRAALLFASMELLPGRKTIRFLEIAASVGAPSLVALSKGYRVWSSDLRPKSAWQRWAGAKASFGAKAPELKRFHTLSVDVTDETTWPNMTFDVIFLADTGLGIWSDEEVASRRTRTGCRGLTELMRTRLASKGLGVVFALGSVLEIRKSDFDCMDHEHFAVAMHKPLAEGGWQSQWLQEEVLQDFRTPHNLPIAFTLRRRNETNL